MFQKQLSYNNEDFDIIIVEMYDEGIIKWKQKLYQVW